jgi:hypothetical protein
MTKIATFWTDSEYLGKINIKKKNQIFFQCLALPKNPQSFGFQNLRCPFSVSQYYRRRRLCLVELSAITGGWLTSSFTCLVTLFWMARTIKNCTKMAKNSQNGKKPSKNTRVCEK